jgi:hypothetical protein
VKDKADGQHPLKPDLVGIHGKTSSQGLYSWTEIQVGVEVKLSWSSVLKQAACYVSFLSRGAEIQKRHWLQLNGLCPRCIAGPKYLQNVGISEQCRC